MWLEGRPLTCSHSTARSGWTHTHTRSPVGRWSCARKPPRARRGSADTRPHTSFQSTLGRQAGISPARTRLWPCTSPSRAKPSALRHLSHLSSPRLDFPDSSAEECPGTPRSHGKHSHSVGETCKGRDDGLPGPTTREGRRGGHHTTHSRWVSAERDCSTSKFRGKH